jgi:hypothetical protein
MALVTQFEARPLSPSRLHSPVLCGYNAVSVQGTRILQLETYGSDDRAMPGKVSQVIQLDEDGAQELKAIIERAFPNLS